MAWIAVQSKKHPGRTYYYNRETKESTWECPADLKESDNASKRSPYPALDGSISRASMGTDCTLATVSKEKRPTSLARSDSGSSCIADQNAVHDAAEDMDCSEKWGEESEVAMDVDVTNQLDTVIEMVHAARRLLTTNTTTDELECFGISEMADQHTFRERLYLVLDTNVLLSHMEFLNELKDSSIKDVGRPVLMVPWVVMQELDALKTNNKLVGSKARKAIDFLHGCFTSRHPRVRGQSMLELSTEFNNRAIGNNDDSILHCCLLYQEQVKAYNGIVILFTNDKQLYNKAVISGVLAMDRRALLPELRAMLKTTTEQDALVSSTVGGGALGSCGTPMSESSDVPVVQRCDMLVESRDRRPHLLPLTIQGSATSSMTSSPVTPSPITPSTPPAQKSTLSEVEVRQLLNVAEIALQEALTAGIERELKEAYDNMWMDIVAVKPPWSLRDATFLIDRHWLPVFGIALHRGVKEQSTVINRHASRRPSHITSQYVRELLQSAVFMIRAFKEKSDCGGVLTSALNTVTKVLEQLDTTVSTKDKQATKSLHPLVTLTPAEEKKVALQHLRNSQPTHPPDQFKWSLDLVAVTLEYYILQVPEMLRACPTIESQVQFKTSMRQLCEVSEVVAVCLSNVDLSNTTAVQGVVLSLGRFMEHVLDMSCPVTVEGMCSFIMQSEGNKALFVTMLSEIRKGLSQLVSLIM